MRRGALANAASALVSGDAAVTDMVTGTPWLLAFYHDGHWFKVEVTPSDRREIDEFFGAELDRLENTEGDAN